MRHFKQLAYTDRLNIEKWLREGMGKGENADKLRVHRNTITNELKRGRYTHLNSDYTTEERYSPDIAEPRYQGNLRAKGPGYKIGGDIAAFLVPDHTAASAARALNKIERRLGAKRFRQVLRAVTVDNGCELQDRKAREQSCLRKESGRRCTTATRTARGSAAATKTKPA